VDNSARASRQARMMRDRAGQPMGQPPPGLQVSAKAALRGERSCRQSHAICRAHLRGPAAQTAAQAASEAAAQLAAQNATLGEPRRPLLARLHRHTSFYLNGAFYTPPQLFAPPAATGAQPTAAQQPSQTTQPSPASESVPGQPAGPLGLPPWAADLHGNQVRGLVLDGQDLFLVAIDQRHVEGSGLLTVITSLPVDSALMDVVAQGLDACASPAS